MANEVRIVIRADNRADAAFRDAVQDSHRLDRALHEAAESAAEVGQNAQEAGGAVEDLGQSGEGALGGLGDAAGGAGGMLGKLGPIGAAAGAALGVAMAAGALAVKGLQAAIGASIQRASELGRMKAQLLLSPEEAKQYAKVAAKVYTDNWGESLEQASDYVRDAALYIMPTLNEMKGSIQPSLDMVAERVAALAATMDEDGKKVAATIKQMLVTGMAGSAEEAFNIIHAGIAKGVNSADDLLDTFVEYSTQFRQLGLDGKQAMGLLSQGLKAGARDADTVADGLKEIAIRAMDGSKTSADAFKALGLDAKKLSARFAAGGPGAAAALDQVLDKLRAIEDPAARSAAAVGLFGTKAEDMQTALFNLDLTTATDALGDIAGAADNAAAHMSGNAFSALAAYQRKWEMFQADMGDKLLPVFEKFMAAMERFATAVAPVVKQMLADISQKWNENKVGIQQFGDLMEKVLGVVGPAVIGVIYMSIMGLINTIALVGNAWQGVQDAFFTAARAILEVLGTIVHGAATAFGWIPGIGPKLQQAAADFDGFAGRVNRALNNIQDKTVHVNVVTNAPQIIGANKNSGLIKIAASGGIRSGVTLVGEHGPELVDLGASSRVMNNNTSRRMVTGDGGGGGTTIVTIGGAGNGAGMMADALNTLLRYMINNGSIPLRADLRNGQVRVA